MQASNNQEEEEPDWWKPDEVRTWLEERYVVNDPLAGSPQYQLLRSTGGRLHYMRLSLQERLRRSIEYHDIEYPEGFFRGRWAHPTCSTYGI